MESSGLYRHLQHPGGTRLSLAHRLDIAAHQTWMDSYGTVPTFVKILGAFSFAELLQTLSPSTHLAPPFCNRAVCVCNVIAVL